VFNGGVLRTFGPKTDEAAGGWKNCITRILIIYTLLEMLLGRSNEGEGDGEAMYHTLERSSAQPIKFR
jgi:hypothetical protein